jgi:hypothetical protein
MVSAKEEEPQLLQMPRTWCPGSRGQRCRKEGEKEGSEEGKRRRWEVGRKEVEKEGGRRRKRREEGRRERGKKKGGEKEGTGQHGSWGGQLPPQERLFSLAGTLQAPEALGPSEDTWVVFRP